MITNRNQYCGSGPILFGSGFRSYLDIPSLFLTNKMCMPFLTWSKHLVTLKINDENLKSRKKIYIGLFVDYGSG